MKKARCKTARKNESEMRAEYNFAGGVRGKYYKSMQGGYTITIHKADGTTVVKDVKPAAGSIISKFV